MYNVPDFFFPNPIDLSIYFVAFLQAHLQHSGNSISRQIASMYRTFQEIKDTEDEDDGSDYDQYSNDDVDSQCADRDDDLDTEDDVNKMSDLETDSSVRSAASTRKKQLKRPPPLQLQEQQQKSVGSEKDPNGNEVKRGVGLSLPADSADDEQAENTDFYPDFETSSSDDCSHCLCCSSLASYSSGYRGNMWISLPVQLRSMTVTAPNITVIRTMPL